MAPHTFYITKIRGPAKTGIGNPPNATAIPNAFESATVVQWDLTQLKLT